MQSVFDGHNDVLSRLWKIRQDGFDPVSIFRDGDSLGHLDAKRAHIGNLAGGICALYVPGALIKAQKPDSRGYYHDPQQPTCEHHSSLESILAQFSIAYKLHHSGIWRICSDYETLKTHLQSNIFCCVLHLEGCEALDKNLSALEVFYGAGLRSLGVVWSRQNIFGHGVPFAFPSSPDTGSGLTPVGFDLIKECDRMGIVIDLSHITEKGFWDVIKTSSQPLVASHSNAHFISPAARNLTDRQLDALKERKGLIGFTFAGRLLQLPELNRDLSLLDMVRHFDYLVQRVGIDCVAFGSDFDGAVISPCIHDVTGIPRFIKALEKAGYTSCELKKICQENWLRIFKSVWRVS